MEETCKKLYKQEQASHREPPELKNFDDGEYDDQELPFANFSSFEAEVQSHLDPDGLTDQSISIKEIEAPPMHMQEPARLESLAASIIRPSPQLPKPKLAKSRTHDKHWDEKRSEKEANSKPPPPPKRKREPQLTLALLLALSPMNALNLKKKAAWLQARVDYAECMKGYKKRRTS
ncbi:hypothetical protein HGRIS_001409 [Hohenbuehelia grisea]|uniref:Uncharacterized protein n=1 Tax=Hohenbuehelia grisea TaxID=104357 RepID=A0ABR3IPE8_9AGAR